MRQDHEIYDVIVMGGGIIGTSIASALSKYQLRIGLIESENDVAMGSSKANSGIVHGGYAESPDSLRGQLCYPGRMAFQNLSQELGFPYRKTGSLVLAFDEEELFCLETLLERGKLNGLKDLTILTHKEIVAMEPGIIKEAKYALHCAGAGVCSPYEMTIAMAENALENGAELFLNQPVIGTEKIGDFFHIHTLNPAGQQQTYRCNFLINATGIGAQKIAEMLGDSLDLFHRSGEYMIYGSGSGDILKQVIFQVPTLKGKGILVAPTAHGNLLVGPDALDIEGEDRSTHKERLEVIHESARKILPQLEVAGFIRSFAGVRTISRRDDFVIQPSKTKGLIHVAGIQSPGLTSSPAITEMVMKLLQEEGLSLNQNPDYRIRSGRIQKAPLRPMKEIASLLEIKGRERILCRCEQVNQGVLEEVLAGSIPITSGDGVKRRTRAGMGFCQGEFCRPRIGETAQQLGYELDMMPDYQRKGYTRVTGKEMKNPVE